MKNDRKNQYTEEKIAELTGQLEEEKRKYLRALADYQNLEKQTANWREEFVKYANAGLIRKQLEVLDDLEKADEHLQNEGLKLIIAKLKNILTEEGLTELEVLGKEYDPNLAEVVGTGPGEQNNAVVGVIQKGYRIGEKIVRAAKVIVAKNNQVT